MGMVVLEVRQQTYVFRVDDGSELPKDWSNSAPLDPAGASVLVDFDTSPSSQPSEGQLSNGSIFRVAISLSANFEATDTSVFSLQRSINGGAWTDVTTSSPLVRIEPSAHVSNITSTVQWLLSWANYEPGWFLSTQNSASITWNGGSNQNTGFEWCLRLVEGFEPGDSVEFRILDNSSELFQYNKYPLLTIGTESPAAPTLLLPEEFDEAQPSEFSWEFNEGLITTPDSQEGYALARHGVSLRELPWKTATWDLARIGTRFTSTGNLVVGYRHETSTSYSGTRRIWECYSLETGNMIGSFNQVPDWNSFWGHYVWRTPQRICISPNGQRLYARASSGLSSGYAFSLPGLSELTTPSRYTGNSSDASEDDNHAATLHASVFVMLDILTLRIWDIDVSITDWYENLDLAVGASGDSWGLSCVRWSPDGTRVVVLSSQQVTAQKLWIFDTSSWTEITGPQISSGPAHEGQGLDFSPDGSLLLIENTDGTFVYRTSDWGLEYTFPTTKTGRLYDAWFSPNGLLVGGVRTTATGTVQANPTHLWAIDPWTGVIHESVTLPPRVSSADGLSALTHISFDNKFLSYFTNDNRILFGDINETFLWNTEWWNDSLGQWQSTEHVNPSTTPSAIIPFGGWDL